MSTDLQIRPYQPQDEEAICRLWSLVFPDDPPWNEPARMLAEKRAFQPEGVLVGIRNHALVAAVLAGYDGHRGWINSLAVHPDHRGAGDGPAMLEAAVAHLDALGANKVNLQIRRSDNLKLQQFYEKCGFQVEERISMSRLTNRARGLSR